MRSEIEKKLQRALSAGPITTEAQVVWVMVKLRKLLDMKLAGPNDTLKPFCNWIVHSEIDKESSATPILSAFEPSLVAIVDKGSISLSDIDSVLPQPLRENLGAFLDTLGLPNPITTSDREWSEFWTSYSSAVTDCPVTASSNYQGRLTGLCIRHASGGVDSYIRELIELGPDSEVQQFEMAIVVDGKKYGPFPIR